MTIDPAADSLGLRGAATLGRLGIVLEEELGGGSGSRVLAGRRGSTPVAVKLTTLTTGQDRTRAGRELVFLQEWAHRVPVPVPRLLDAVMDDDVVVLVMERHRPVPLPQEWPPRRWLQVVDLLAALHESPAPTGASWTKDPAALLPLEDPRVRALVRSPRDRRLLHQVFDPGRPDEVAALPKGWVHGDAHAGNLLFDEHGSLVLADWQECGVADPAGDLAFLLARAWPVGARPPVAALTTRYARSRGLDPDAVARAVTAHELQVLTRQYPAHLDQLDEVEVDRIRRRFRSLAAQWWAPRSTKVTG